MNKGSFFQKLVWIVLILAVWEITARCGIVNTYILPPFGRIMYVMADELINGVLLIQVWNSLKIVWIGFAASILFSVICAVLCMLSRLAESFILTICTVLNPLPGVALMPLFMMWFGLGNGVLLALIVHGIAWPLITSLLAGYHAIPRIYIEWANNMECPFINRIFHIYIYCVMPHLLSGLRIGWGRAWRALIAGEMVFGMIGDLGGLGYYIYKARAFGNMECVFAGIVIIILIGLSVEELLFKAVEKNTVEKWGISSGK